MVFANEDKILSFETTQGL